MMGEIMQKERLQPISLKNGKIQDAFWLKYIGKVSETILPYQWKLMNDQVKDTEKSGCIQNFRIAAGMENGEFTGMPFQDSDLAKWMEAVAFSLAAGPNPKLENIMDEMVDLLSHAQEADGYMDTYFMLKEPEKKWLNLHEGHELYVAGHFIEAAVAYYKVTGKKKFLDIVCKNADLICDTFGNGENQIPGYPGHQEVELALVKLFEVTGNERYLKQAQFFLMERGKEPYILEELHKKYGSFIFPEFEKFDRKYNQIHLPVMEQKTAEGHAVRAVYMYSAMADLAWYTQDEKLFKVCEELYENITKRRMYITGGIGSAGIGERFTCDYDLPNHSGYNESCASIGLAMFCQRMLRNTGNGKYGDTMEIALYNTVLAGIGLDGQKFFYVNPLEVWPDACDNNTDLVHVKKERQSWFTCACCPPNIVRTLASIQSYACFVCEDRIYWNLYIGGNWKFILPAGEIIWEMQTEYPFKNEIRMKVVSVKGNGHALLALRKPGWCEKAELWLNGKEIPAEECTEKGFIILDEYWKEGMELVLCLSMEPMFIQANPKVRADAGKTALVKGPLVYCLEEEDNGNNLSAVSVSPKAEIKEEFRTDILGGLPVLKLQGFREVEETWGEELYRPWNSGTVNTELIAVPYCYWNNRESGEMQVWLRTI